MLYHEPFEKITRWQIKQARKYAKEQGPGVPEEKTTITAYVCQCQKSITSLTL